MSGLTSFFQWILISATFQPILVWFLGGISIRKSTQTGWVVYRVGLDVFVGFWMVLVVLTRCRKPDGELENLTE